MFYLFKKELTNTSPVNYVQVGTTTELRLALQKAASSALFIYDQKTDEIKIISEFYDLLECSFFIYSHLGLFKPISSLKIKSSTD
jgi:hypothetical protein